MNTTKKVIININEIIWDTLKADDLIEVNRLLKIVHEAFSDKNVDSYDICNVFTEIIKNHLRINHLKIFNGDLPKYNIFQPHESIPPYLASYGLGINKLRQFKHNIRNLIYEIEENVIAPSGLYLLPDDEEKILAILCNKYPFWEILSETNPINIVNIKHSHRKHNAICGSDDNYSSFIIYMFNIKDGLSPEYVFLHELGHILQMVLMQSDIHVPETFITFNKNVMMVDLLQGEVITIEAFADLFAVAVMYGTELNKFNPFLFSDDIMDQIGKFYYQLICKQR